MKKLSLITVVVGMLLSNVAMASFNTNSDCPFHKQNDNREENPKKDLVQQASVQPTNNTPAPVIKTATGVDGFQGT